MCHDVPMCRQIVIPLPDALSFSQGVWSLRKFGNVQSWMGGQKGKNDENWRFDWFFPSFSVNRTPVFFFLWLNGG